MLPDLRSFLPTMESSRYNRLCGFARRTFSSFSSSFITAEHLVQIESREKSDCLEVWMCAVLLWPHLPLYKISKVFSASSGPKQTSSSSRDIEISFSHSFSVPLNPFGWGIWNIFILFSPKWNNKLLSAPDFMTSPEVLTTSWQFTSHILWGRPTWYLPGDHKCFALWWPNVALNSLSLTTNHISQILLTSMLLGASFVGLCHGTRKDSPEDKTLSNRRLNTVLTLLAK